MGMPVGFWNIAYFTVLGIGITLLMVDSRFPMRQTIMAGCGEIVFVLALEFLLCRVLGIWRLIEFYTLLVHLPCLLFFCVVQHYLRCKAKPAQVWNGEKPMRKTGCLYLPISAFYRPFP